MSGARQDPTTVNVSDYLAYRLACRWVRLYTAPLPRAARDIRRAELESDLWDHLDDAHANQVTKFATNVAVLTRMLIGIPSDLIWVGRVRRYVKESRPMKQRRLRAIAVLCTGFALIDLVASNLLVDKAKAEQGSTIWWILTMPIGFLLVGTIGVVATALLIQDRRASRVAATGRTDMRWTWVIRAESDARRRPDRAIGPGPGDDSGETG